MAWWGVLLRRGQERFQEVMGRQSSCLEASLTKFPAELPGAEASGQCLLITDQKILANDELDARVLYPKQQPRRRRSLYVMLHFDRHENTKSNALWRYHDQGFEHLSPTLEDVAILFYLFALVNPYVTEPLIDKASPLAGSLDNRGERQQSFS